MKKKLRFISLILVLTMAVVLLNGCGQDSESNSESGSNASSSSNDFESKSTKDSGSKSTETSDTIKALLPPISSGFLDRIDKMAANFHEEYPNLTLEIEPASWDDRIEKLDTQVNAGTPPDIAFLGYEFIPKYVNMGVAMDITKYADSKMISDFDNAPLEYMKNGDGLYGFPAYMEIHGIGGNKEYMDLAGIDWRNIQTNGWTFDEFREAVKKGQNIKGENSTSEYGFVFATAGAITKDFIEIFTKNAGLPSPFTEDLKYAYTSKNFLNVLNAVSQLIDDGAANMNATAGERWNLFLTGKTMLTGKGLATFENSAKINNEKLKSNDGSAVEGSVPVDYVVMPVPTIGEVDPCYFAVVDGYVTFRAKEAPTEEHMKNVVKASYFLASGDVAAETNSELFAVNIANSAKEAESKYPIERDTDNLAATKHLMEKAAPARPDIPVDKLADATKIMDEVIVPKFQALIVKEITPEEMYDAVYEAAVSKFGEDGIVKD